jgi:hypothetical protein
MRFALCDFDEIPQFAIPQSSIQNQESSMVLLVKTAIIKIKSKFNTGEERMFWICPLCGYQNEGTTMRCMCGFIADESLLKQSPEEEADIFGGQEEITDQIIEMPLSSFNEETDVSEQPQNNKEGKDMGKKQNESDDEFFFKEIDSWKISFSGKDQCVYFGTPALQSFRLKLTMEDVKGLLDFISENANIEIAAKTKLISGKEIADLVEMLEQMIEVKKAKFKIKFANDELQGIADIINKKLKE